jgi:diadenosine tetraphosphate (Ap4A) HIT family hydrolase
MTDPIDSAITPSVFTRIISGEFPGHFVYEDDVCVAFLSIQPLQTGHTLVVPREQIDHWLDLDEATLDHLMRVSSRIGRALQSVYDPAKVGMMVAGLEVPHVHVHLVPIESAHDLDFANATDASTDELAAAATLIKDHLND